ncbi:MAG TPA: hypothetical protein DG851_01150 [Lactobacillus acetotolerans]|nr:hypothetical protein [Lactobacillus acetotolerans]
MGSTNYKKALVRIHHLEDEYGSVIYVPDSDPELQEIHRLLPFRRQSKGINYDRILWLNRQGYSTAYIAQATHHSKDTINAYFRYHHIKSKQTFKYRVGSNFSTNVYYSASLIHLASLLLHKTILTTATAKRQLTMHGFSIKTGFYVWYRIPDGAYYTLYYLDHFAVKNGLDSYIYNT